MKRQTLLAQNLLVHVTTLLHVNSAITVGVALGHNHINGTDNLQHTLGQPGE